MLRALAIVLFAILGSGLYVGTPAAVAEVSVADSTLTITADGSDAAGLEMQVPEGWAVTSREESRATLQPADADELSASITILATDRVETKNLLRHDAKLESLGIIDSNSGETDCKNLASKIVPLNGQRVFHGVRECVGKEAGQGRGNEDAGNGAEDEAKGKEKANEQRSNPDESGGKGSNKNDGKVDSANENSNKDSKSDADASNSYYSKLDLYVIFTLDKSFVVSLSASSPEAYDRHLAAFERSLKSIEVKEAADFMYSLEAILGSTRFYSKDVKLNDTEKNQTLDQQSQSLESNPDKRSEDQVKLNIATSSKISSIEFETEEKRISIKVDEDRRSEGNMLIPVDQVLRGPYQVYINGEPSENYSVITDENETSQLINVWYDKGTHEIEIVGTQVVPEFGIAALAALTFVMMLSMVLIYRYRALQGLT